MTIEIIPPPLEETTTEEATGDPKPGKWLMFHIPAILAVLSAVFAAPACDCRWTKLIVMRLIAGFADFVFWWVILIVGFHGYHFLRNFLATRRSKDPNV